MSLRPAHTTWTPITTRGTASRVSLSQPRLFGGFIALSLLFTGPPGKRGRMGRRGEPGKWRPPPAWFVYLSSLFLEGSHFLSPRPIYSRAKLKGWWNRWPAGWTDHGCSPLCPCAGTALTVDMCLLTSPRCLSGSICSSTDSPSTTSAVLHDHEARFLWWDAALLRVFHDT